MIEYVYHKQTKRATGVGTITFCFFCVKTNPKRNRQISWMVKEASTCLFFRCVWAVAPLKWSRARAAWDSESCSRIWEVGVGEKSEARMAIGSVRTVSLVSLLGAGAVPNSPDELLSRAALEVSSEQSGQRRVHPPATAPPSEQRKKSAGPPVG
jgi:hypothetical protein